MRSLVFLSCVLLLGCSKPEVTVNDSQGAKVTVDQGDQQKTVVDAKGNATVIQKPAEGRPVNTQRVQGDTAIDIGDEISEADLGLVFYPGSKQVTGRAMKTDTPTDITAATVRTTTDAPEKVIEFYKARLSNTKTRKYGPSTSLTGKTAAGGTATVIAMPMAGPNPTQITITVNTKKK